MHLTFIVFFAVTFETIDLFVYFFLHTLKLSVLTCFSKSWIFFSELTVYSITYLITNL